jgi:Heavy metal binding domain
MTKKIYAALISLAAAFVCAAPHEATAQQHDGHRHQGRQHQGEQHAAKRKPARARKARARASARRRSRRQAAVAYVCPMHPDIRERAWGTCPKCMMDLVAEPGDAKAGGTKNIGVEAEASAPVGRGGGK